MFLELGFFKFAAEHKKLVVSLDEALMRYSGTGQSSLVLLETFGDPRAVPTSTSTMLRNFSRAVNENNTTAHPPGTRG